MPESLVNAVLGGLPWWKAFLLVVSGGVIGGVITVLVQRRLRREEKVFSERGKVYQTIVENLWGFSAPKELMQGQEWEDAVKAKNTFIVEARKAWLFAPVDVVRHLRDFQNEQLKAQTKQEEKENEPLNNVDKIKIELIKLMRKDLGISTKTPKDEDIFKVFIPTRKSQKS